MKQALKPSAKYFMQYALNLASERRGFCAPNPAVGAVVVKNNQIIGKGNHWGSGEPHAEVMAIREAGEAAEGADLYVTLEPCCHYGKTPPCTELLIRTKIQRAFYGFKDPNPQVSGQGELKLKAAGIKCELLPLDEVRQFYNSYQFWWQTRLPWVTAKLAISLDGKIAGPEGQPVKITGEACHLLTHQHRRQSDAILTSINTVIADNPQLTARDGVVPQKKSIFVLDRSLKFPSSVQLLETSARLTLLHGPTAPPQKIDYWQNRGVQCQLISESNNKLEWLSILKFIGSLGVHDLWIEAGGRCFQSLWLERRAQSYLLYIAPKILGSKAKNAFDQPLTFLQNDGYELLHQTHGKDIVLQIRSKQNHDVYSQQTSAVELVETSLI